MTDIVEKHPECCPELWKELHRIARATCRPDDVVSAASAALGMPASEFENDEVATHKLELEELYEAFRHSDELAYFVLDRDELSGSLLGVHAQTAGVARPQGGTDEGQGR